MKKIIVLLIICLFIPNFSSAYVDLSKEHMAYESVLELYEKNIVSGYLDDTFRPDDYITEEELITILLRGANLDLCKSFKNWPQDYNELAANNGIIVDESLVTTEELEEFINKLNVLPAIKNFDNTYTNMMKDKKMNISTEKLPIEYITRAEACMYINNAINNDGKVASKFLPRETEVYFLSDEYVDIPTVINSLEVFEYDTYTGKYADTINLFKTGDHRYLKFRDERAKGKYIIAIEFDTINNTQYGVWTSCDSLLLRGAKVINKFDTDEIKCNLKNTAYNYNLVKPNENYVVTAFYIVDSIPENLVIERDINTIYDLQTHAHIDVHSFSRLEIKDINEKIN